jgi:hypothetical protein
MQGPIPFKAKVSATISAILQGPERVALFLGTFFLIIVLFSLPWLSSTAWAIVSFLIGLAGLLILLFHWLVKGYSYQSEAPLTTMMASPDEIYLSTAKSIDPEKFLPILRNYVQNRQPLPPPYGAVTNGRPQDNEGLSEYPSEKRTQISEDIQAQILKHDEEFMKRLKEVEERLPKLLSKDNKEPPVQTEIKNKTDVRTD